LIPIGFLSLTTFMTNGKAASRMNASVRKCSLPPAERCPPMQTPSGLSQRIGASLTHGRMILPAGKAVQSGDKTTFSGGRTILSDGRVNFSDSRPIFSDDTATFSGGRAIQSHNRAIQSDRNAIENLEIWPESGFCGRKGLRRGGWWSNRINWSVQAIGRRLGGGGNAGLRRARGWRGRTKKTRRFMIW